MERINITAVAETDGRPLARLTRPLPRVDGHATYSLRVVPGPLPYRLWVTFAAAEVGPEAEWSLVAACATPAAAYAIVPGIGTSLVDVAE